MSSPLSPHYYEFCRKVGRVRCWGIMADAMLINGSFRLAGMDDMRPVVDGVGTLGPIEHHNDNE